MTTTLIGCYATLNSTMRFYETRRGDVKVQIGQDDAKVKTPTLSHHSYIPLKMTAEQVKWLLGNALFKPRLSGHVYFNSYEASDIGWKVTQLNDRDQCKILDLQKKEVDWKAELKKAGHSDQDIKSYGEWFQEQGFVFKHFVATSSKLFFTCRADQSKFHTLVTEVGEFDSYDFERSSLNSISSICLLTDELIAIGTEGPSGGVKIYSTMDLEECTIDSDPLTDRQSGVASIHSLDSGEIAIVTENRHRKNGVVILTPYVKRDEKKYEVEALKLNIKHFPEKIENYRKLAQIYRRPRRSNLGVTHPFWYSDDLSAKKCSRVSLSGIRPAVRQGHLYFARRFFEEARVHYEDEAFSIYESELKRGGFTKDLERVKRMRYGHELDEKTFKEIEDQTSRPCKKRLFVGEGNFSYTESVIGKHRKTHPNLAKAITATELREPLENEKTRIKRLQKYGVRILSQIKAAEIDHQFSGERFERIQWNCPFALLLKKREEHKHQLTEFFEACFSLQQIGDRVHVTLRKSSSDQYEKDSYNNVLVAATRNDYGLIRKRRMDRDRYRIYRPCKSETGEQMNDFTYREFVFEKKESGIPCLTPLEAVKEKAEDYQDPDTKVYQVDEHNNWLYYNCSTDEDSSDYYESDEDEPIKRSRPDQTPKKSTKRRKLV